MTWGFSTDKLVPADYDGDGIADIAVWRSSDGIWYVLPSNSSGSYQATQWGMEGDVAISPLTMVLGSIH